MRAAEPADQSDVFHGRAAVARGMRQAIDRLAGLRLSGEQSRHAHRQALGHPARELAILRVGVGDASLAVGDHCAEWQAVDDRLGTVRSSSLWAKPEKAGRQPEQRRTRR
jgi:hypothetical protein